MALGAFGGPWVALWKGLVAFGEAFGTLCLRLWESLADLWEHWGALARSPELILADSCSEISGSKGDPWGTLEVPWGLLEAWT